MATKYTSGAYYVLPDLTIWDGDWSPDFTQSIMGPFSSIEAAKEAIRETVKDCFKMSDSRVDDDELDDFSGSYMILQAVECVHPLPVVDVRVVLQSVGLKKS